MKTQPTREQVLSIFEEMQYKDIVDALLDYTNGDIEKLTSISEYLAKINWKEVIGQKQLVAQYILEQAVSKGGGKCERCHNIDSPLYPFTNTENFAGKFCKNCTLDIEKYYDIPHPERRLPCDKCHLLFPFKSLTLPTFELSRDYKHYLRRGFCADCMKEIIEAQTIICPGCGKTVLEHRDPETCDDCYTKYPEAQIVSSHRSRARALSLPASLTLEQWKAAVEFFKHKCAFCSKPYVILEHFTPLSKGGGTTADNCVPACARCNSRKGDKHPSTIDGLFPSDNLARIRSWLEGRNQQ